MALLGPISREPNFSATEYKERFFLAQRRSSEIDVLCYTFEYYRSDFNRYYASFNNLIFT